MSPPFRLIFFWSNTVHNAFIDFFRLVGLPEFEVALLRQSPLIFGFN